MLADYKPRSNKSLPSLASSVKVSFQYLVAQSL